MMWGSAAAVRRTTLSSGTPKEDEVAHGVVTAPPCSPRPLVEGQRTQIRGITAKTTVLHGM